MRKNAYHCEVGQGLLYPSSSSRDTSCRSWKSIRHCNSPDLRPNTADEPCRWTGRVFCPNWSFGGRKLIENIEFLSQMWKVEKEETLSFVWISYANEFWKVLYAFVRILSRLFQTGWAFFSDYFFSLRWQFFILIDGPMGKTRNGKRILLCPAFLELGCSGQSGNIAVSSSDNQSWPLLRG